MVQPIGFQSPQATVNSSSPTSSEESDSLYENDEYSESEAFQKTLFVFSVAPLALLFAGIPSACGDGKNEKKALGPRETIADGGGTPSQTSVDAGSSEVVINPFTGVVSSCLDDKTLSVTVGGATYSADCKENQECTEGVCRTLETAQEEECDVVTIGGGPNDPQNNGDPLRSSCVITDVFDVGEKTDHDFVWGVDTQLWDSSFSPDAGIGIQHFPASGIGGEVTASALYQTDVCDSDDGLVLAAQEGFYPWMQATFSVHPQAFMYRVEGKLSQGVAGVRENVGVRTTDLQGEGARTGGPDDTAIPACQYGALQTSYANRYTAADQSVSVFLYGVQESSATISGLRIWSCTCDNYDNP